MTATPALTGALAEHPALSQWVAFPAPGKVTIFAGKVEIGQGVLTAMVQLAADHVLLDLRLEGLFHRSRCTAEVDPGAALAHFIDTL